MKILKISLIKSALVMAILAISSQSCDNMKNDVIPSASEIDYAVDVNSSLAVNGPVIINLLQESKLIAPATISIVDNPKKGTLSILSSSLLKYTPNKDFKEGEDEAVYSVCIGGACDEGRLEFNYASSSSTCYSAAVYDSIVAIHTDQQVIIDVLKNDIKCGEGFDIATLKIAEAPKHGRVSTTDGLVFYYPEANYIGPVQLMYSIATKAKPDHLYYGLVDILLQPVPIAIYAVNDKFEYTKAQYNALINNSFKSIDYNLAQVLGNDKIGNLQYNQLGISIITQPVHGQVTYFSLEKFMFVPDKDFTGEDSFTYQICNNGVCRQAMVTIKVTDWTDSSIFKAVNDSFVYTKAEFNELLYNWNNSINYTLNQILDNDALGNNSFNQFKISVTAQPAHGEVIYYSLEMFRFIPNMNTFNGEDHFTYQICKNGECSQAVVTITVKDW